MSCCVWLMFEIASFTRLSLAASNAEVALRASPLNPSVPAAT